MSNDQYKKWEQILNPFGYNVERKEDTLEFSTRHTIDITEIYERGSRPNFQDPTLDSVIFTLRLNGAEKRLLCSDSETGGWYEMGAVCNNQPLLSVASGERVSIEIGVQMKQRVNRIDTTEEFTFMRGEFTMPDSYIGFGGAPTIMFHPEKDFLVFLTVGCKTKEGVPCVTDAQINFKI